MPCAIPYSRTFYAYEQSRCPGFDTLSKSVLDETELINLILINPLEPIF